MSYGHTLRECADIADQRSQKYGPADVNLAKSAEIARVVFDIHLTPEQVAQVLASNKWARDLHEKQADNTLDSINYLAIAKLCREKNTPKQVIAPTLLKETPQ